MMCCDIDVGIKRQYRLSGRKCFGVIAMLELEEELPVEVRDLV